jgi:hypothetical protein
MPEERKPDELSEEELEGANAERLPDREAMSIVKPLLPGEPPPFYTIDPPPPAEA